MFNNFSNRRTYLNQIWKEYFLESEEARGEGSAVIILSRNTPPRLVTSTTPPIRSFQCPRVRFLPSLSYFFAHQLSFFGSKCLCGCHKNCRWFTSSLQKGKPHLAHRHLSNDIIVLRSNCYVILLFTEIIMAVYCLFIQQPPFPAQCVRLLQSRFRSFSQQILFTFLTPMVTSLNWSLKLISIAGTNPTGITEMRTPALQLACAYGIAHPALKTVRMVLQISESNSPWLRKSDDSLTHPTTYTNGRYHHREYHLNSKFSRESYKSSHLHLANHRKSDGTQRLLITDKAEANSVCENKKFSCG